MLAKPTRTLQFPPTRPLQASISKNRTYFIAMPEITEKELPPNLKPLWLKALSAVQTSNLTYGVSLLQAVLKDSPGFLEGRKMLRKCELQIAGGTKKKAGLFGMQSGGMGIMKIASHAKKDPAGALPLIEKELEKDPLNDQANDLLFDTCLKLELYETAAFALETVRKGSPENAKLLHKLAEFYLSREHPMLASEVYNDIIKHHPTDGTAIKGSKDASARASMQKQKWDENADMRSLMKNTAEFEELEKASRTGLTREQLEERRDKVIEKYNLDPNNLATAKDLAGLYEQLEDWHNAHTFFSWAHSLSNGDVALATKAGAIRTARSKTTSGPSKPASLRIPTTLNSRPPSTPAAPTASPNWSRKPRSASIRTRPIRSSVSSSAPRFTIPATTAPPFPTSSRRPATRTSAPRCFCCWAARSAPRACSTFPSNNSRTPSPTWSPWTTPKKKSFTKKASSTPKWATKNPLSTASSKSTKSTTATAMSPSASNHPTPNRRPASHP